MKRGWGRPILLLSLLPAAAGCVSPSAAIVPAVDAGPVRQVPPSSRVLGQAALYVSKAGERAEIIHDPATGVAIVRLPDGTMAVLPPEIAGEEGRYRDDRTTLWENDGGVLLWRDGKLVFTGKAVPADDTR